MLRADASLLVISRAKRSRNIEFGFPPAILSQSPYLDGLMPLVILVTSVTSHPECAGLKGWRVVRAVCSGAVHRPGQGHANPKPARHFRPLAHA